MNKIYVIGNLGRDPEMRYTPSGASVTSFSVASNRRYKTADGQQREETEWFNCSAWGRLAEVCNEHLTKGQQVFLEGRLTSRTYEGRGGETRFAMDINLTEVQFLGRAGNGEGDYERGRGNGGRQGEDHNPFDDIDDLPF